MQTESGIPPRQAVAGQLRFIQRQPSFKTQDFRKTGRFSGVCPVAIVDRSVAASIGTPAALRSE